MRGEAPERLTSLLARLNLASPEQVRSMRARVRRLSSEFPEFESVWVDALAQARILTPYQAAEINAGRGEQLACGDFVLARPIASPAYAACFAARHRETDREATIYVVPVHQGNPQDQASQLDELISRLSPLVRRYAGVVEAGGTWQKCVWAACERLEGITAADCMAQNGRLPPAAVSVIAREMCEQLALLESRSVVHGDLSASGLLFRARGGIALPMPGVRGIVRPSEGYSFNDLPCDAYDYLAPERIARGGPPTIASDIYACGALWWHLLTGRPPFGGGKSLAKLKNVHAARWVDVRALAPHTPEWLAAVISHCTMRDPLDRPQSLHDLRELLGEPARGDQRSLDQALRQSPWHTRRHRAGVGSTHRTAKYAGMAMASLLVALVAGRIAWIHGESAAGVHPKATHARADVPQNRTQPSALPDDVEGLPAAPRRDRQVVQAAAIVADAESIAESDARELVLSAGESVDAESLRLSTGARVHPPRGKRSRVVIARSGLVIDCDDVTFENIDFVCTAGSDDRSLPVERAAMFRLRGANVSWRGCTLTCQGPAAPTTVLVEPEGSGPSPAPSGVNIVDCVIQNLGAIADGAATVSLTNTLCASNGPLVRVSRNASAGEAISLTLDHVTMRAGGGVLEWTYTRLPREPGTVAITVNDSVLDAAEGESLVTLAGRDKPDRLLSCISWSGQGSIVRPGLPITVWRSSERTRQPLADDALEIAGLVRGEIEFAGKADGPPAASRVTRWQGALRSSDPPGINSATLPRLRR